MGKHSLKELKTVAAAVIKGAKHFLCLCLCLYLSDGGRPEATGTIGDKPNLKITHQVVAKISPHFLFSVALPSCKRYQTKFKQDFFLNFSSCF